MAELDDPFTRFLEPSRYAALKRGTAGSLTGVGLEVGFDMGAGSDSDLVVSFTASHTMDLRSFSADFHSGSWQHANCSMLFFEYKGHCSGLSSYKDHSQQSKHI